MLLAYDGWQSLLRPAQLPRPLNCKYKATLLAVVLWLFEGHPGYQLRDSSEQPPEWLFS